MPAKTRTSKTKAVKKPAKKSQTARKKKSAPSKKSAQKKTGPSRKPKRPVEESQSKKRKASESGQSIRKPTKKKKVEEAASKPVEKVTKSTTPARKKRQVKKAATSKKKKKRVEESEMTAVDIIKPALRKLGLTPRKVLSGDLKILSYNVNGIRAAVKKGLLNFLSKEDPDIVCLSETKCNEEDNPLSELEGYTTYWYDCTFKKGYSGTCVFSKTPALSVQKGHGVWDDQGRVITLEYPSFYLCHCYVPNSGEGTHLPHKGRKLKFEDRRKA